MVAFSTLPILNGKMISDVDAAILSARGINQAALMEEAASACTSWLIERYRRQTIFLILCGPGNNGGDGLVIARQLYMAGYTVHVFAAKGKKDSLQAQQYARTSALMPIGSLDDAWSALSVDVAIDALFGVGLQGELRSPYSEYIERFNAASAIKIAIDMPSGLSDERAKHSQAITKAHFTLSLCAPKVSQLWACHESFIGDLHILPLPDDGGVLAAWSHAPQWLTHKWFNNQTLPISRFAHKGNFSRVGISAGSKGMVGAAIMLAKACIRNGAGLTTLHLPQTYHNAVHAAVPEVMLSDALSPDDKAQILALGSGWGRDDTHVKELKAWLKGDARARVIDADAINILAVHHDLLNDLPENTILTPHPMEFSRLTSSAIAENEERIKQAQYFAHLWGVTIVLKGKYTVIAAADGSVWVNSTGNRALAKGGSGDVLTGMITGQLAQGYAPEVAACIAVYKHGLAADNLISHMPPYAVVAADLIEAIIN